MAPIGEAEAKQSAPSVELSGSGGEGRPGFYPELLRRQTTIYPSGAAAVRCSELFGGDTLEP